MKTLIVILTSLSLFCNPAFSAAVSSKQRIMADKMRLGLIPPETDCPNVNKVSPEVRSASFKDLLKLYSQELDVGCQTGQYIEIRRHVFMGLASDNEHSEYFKNLKVLTDYYSELSRKINREQNPHDSAVAKDKHRKSGGAMARRFHNPTVKDSVQHQNLLGLIAKRKRLKKLTYLLEDTYVSLNIDYLMQTNTSEHLIEEGTYVAVAVVITVLSYGLWKNTRLGKYLLAKAHKVARPLGLRLSYSFLTGNKIHPDWSEKFPEASEYLKVLRQSAITTNEDFYESPLDKLKEVMSLFEDENYNDIRSQKDYVYTQLRNSTITGFVAGLAHHYTLGRAMKAMGKKLSVGWGRVGIVAARFISFAETAVAWLVFAGASKLADPATAYNNVEDLLEKTDAQMAEISKSRISTFHAYYTGTYLVKTLAELYGLVTAITWTKYLELEQTYGGKMVCDPLVNLPGAGVTDKLFISINQHRRNYLTTEAQEVEDSTIEYSEGMNSVLEAPGFSSWLYDWLEWKVSKRNLLTVAHKAIEAGLVRLKEKLGEPLAEDILRLSFYRDGIAETLDNGSYRDEVIKEVKADRIEILRVKNSNQKQDYASYEKLRKKYNCSQSTWFHKEFKR